MLPETLEAILEEGNTLALPRILKAIEVQAIYCAGEVANRQTSLGPHYAVAMFSRVAQVFKDPAIMAHVNREWCSSIFDFLCLAEGTGNVDDVHRVEELLKQETNPEHSIPVLLGLGERTGERKYLHRAANQLMAADPVTPNMVWWALSLTRSGLHDFDLSRIIARKISDPSKRMAELGRIARETMLPVDIEAARVYLDDFCKVFAFNSFVAACWVNITWATKAEADAAEAAQAISQVRPGGISCYRCDLQADLNELLIVSGCVDRVMQDPTRRCCLEDKQQVLKEAFRACLKVGAFEQAEVLLGLAGKSIALSAKLQLAKAVASRRAEDFAAARDLAVQESNLGARFDILMEIAPAIKKQLEGKKQ